MAKTKVVLNRSGIRELLRSREMLAFVEAQAEAMLRRCGSGYERDSFVGKNRVNAMIWPSSFKAQRDNQKNNTILKAMK